MGTQEKTMKLDPKIVEAAMWPITNWKQREVRARRVLKAASECVPSGVVDAAGKAFAKYLPELGDPDYKAKITAAMHAALSAGLAKWAEEE
jgi:hypothetical protein